MIWVTPLFAENFWRSSILKSPTKNSMEPGWSETKSCMSDIYAKSLFTSLSHDTGIFILAAVQCSLVTRRNWGMPDNAYPMHSSAAARQHGLRKVVWCKNQSSILRLTSNLQCSATEVCSNRENNNSLVLVIHFTTFLHWTAEFCYGLVTNIQPINLQKSVW